jgi:lysophospholipase L1-like esterase
MTTGSVFVLGDSISMHYGPHLADMLKGKLRYARKTGGAAGERNLDQPAGANGGDSAMVLDYLAALVRAGGIPADLLLLNCGLHDIKTDPATGDRQVGPDAYRRNLAAVVALLAGTACRLAWVRTTPVDDKLHAGRGCGFDRCNADVVSYNAIADAVMREASVPTADLYTFTLGFGVEAYTDGVHFNEATRRLQAAFLAGFLDAIR